MRTLHATKPNQLLHFDFLFFGPSVEGYVYILILKDCLSNYVWLRPCKEADGTIAMRVIVEWCAAFRIVHKWASDQGHHFCNTLMAAVAAELRVRYRFTTAYAPWAKGTVEVACRQTLKAFRKLCSDFKLSFQEWPEVLHVVQSVLNNASSSNLRGNCPLTVFCFYASRKLYHYGIGKGSSWIDFSGTAESRAKFQRSGVAVGGC
jgi:transposase InsO family protein